MSYLTRGRKTFWKRTGEALSAPRGGASAPKTAQITLSENVSYEQAYSAYGKNKDRSAGTQILIPLRIDPREPLWFSLLWFSDGDDTDPITWDLYVNRVCAGNVLTKTTTEYPVITQEVEPTDTPLQVIKTDFLVEIPDLEPGDDLGFSLTRRGSVDTNSDTAVTLTLAWAGVFGP